MDGIATVLLRTTLCTVFAAGFAKVLLSKKRVQSPRVHRVIWTLVLVQGWLFFPFLAIPIGPAGSDDAAKGIILVGGEDPEMNSSLSVLVDREVLDEQGKLNSGGQNWVAILWAGGALAVALNFLKRYALLVHKVPLGRKPTKTEWETEWSQIARESGAGTRTHFRITDETGPLCCFIPFFYLVLVPERLWGQFDRKQRQAILRHELAHVTRHDLWKSLAVRLLALPQWFNPFAWKAVRAFDEAAEWACDDLVMSAHTDDYRASYPAALLQIAESAVEPLPLSVAARGGMIATRIRRLVQPRFTEETTMNKMLIPLLLCGLAMAQSVRIEADETDQVETQSQVLAPPALPPEVELAIRKTDLARTGLVPYRVAPPDIITVKTTLPNTPSSKNSDAVASEHVLSPSGTINLDGLGDIYIAGKTAAEISQLLNQRLEEHSKRERVAVDVTQRNSKVVYVIFRGDTDFVFRIPCTPDTDVLSVLTATIPHPVDSEKARIHVTRDMKIIENVDWKELSTNRDSKCNAKLLPGDRVFVIEAGRAALEDKQSKAVDDGRLAIPPPFILRNLPAGATFGDVELFTYNGPKPNNWPSSALLPVPIFPSSVDDVRNSKVRLHIEVLSDGHDNMMEFDALKDDSMFVANAKRLAASLRILKKNRLIEATEIPAITCKLGQQSFVEFEGLRIEVTPRCLDGMWIQLTTKIRNTTTYSTPTDVGAFAMIRKGQALVLQAVKEDSIYVVLTPELLR